MKSRKKFLEYSLVSELLEKKAGACASDVALLCVNKKQSNDEKIADSLKKKVTEIRTTLNRLHYHGLAEYTKTRNKKTGWYSYSWKINEKKIIELVISEAKEEMEKLQKQSRQTTEYSLFNCKNKCGEMSFEIAMQYNFQCPECGNKMDSINEAKRMNDLNTKREKLGDILKELEKKL